jgi:hypothetical protein
MANPSTGMLFEDIVGFVRVHQSFDRRRVIPATLFPLTLDAGNALPVTRERNKIRPYLAGGIVAFFDRFRRFLPAGPVHLSIRLPPMQGATRA